MCAVARALKHRQSQERRTISSGPWSSGTMMWWTAMSMTASSPREWRNQTALPETSSSLIFLPWCNFQHRLGARASGDWQLAHRVLKVWTSSSWFISICPRRKQFRAPTRIALIRCGGSCACRRSGPRRSSLSMSTTAATTTGCSLGLGCETSGLAAPMRILAVWLKSLSHLSVLCFRESNSKPGLCMGVQHREMEYRKRAEAERRLPAPSNRMPHPAVDQGLQVMLHGNDLQSQRSHLSMDGATGRGSAGGRGSGANGSPIRVDTGEGFRQNSEQQTSNRVPRVLHRHKVMRNFRQVFCFGGRPHSLRDCSAEGVWKLPCPQHTYFVHVVNWDCHWDYYIVATAQEGEFTLAVFVNLLVVN